MIRGHLLKWAGPPPSDGKTGSEPVDLRVTFESGVEEEATTHLEMENCGTTAIYYSWKVHTCITLPTIKICYIIYLEILVVKKIMPNQAFSRSLIQE